LQGEIPLLESDFNLTANTNEESILELIMIHCFIYDIFKSNQCDSVTLSYVGVTALDNISFILVAHSLDFLASN